MPAAPRHPAAGQASVAGASAPGKARHDAAVSASSEQPPTRPRSIEMLDARRASLLALSLIAVALPACGDGRPPPAPTAVAPAPPDAVTATPAAAPPAAPPAPADP